MKDVSICRFIPISTSEEVISVINFVYETDINMINMKKTASAYVVNLITQGEAEVSFYEKKYKLKKGDIFFMFPATTYEIKSDNCRMMYISYIGQRAAKIMDKLKITRINSLFSGCGEIEDLWEKSIEIMNPVNMDMLSESVLLYTFSFVGSNENEDRIKITDSIVKVKRYTDDNFRDSDMSLEKVCRIYHYNNKYISTVFKKQLGIGFSRYLNTIRIRHACVLMDEGFTSVKDISTQCGFSDQLYFSRVFKKITGVTPSEHIRNL